ncbi:MAG: hypothetical protein ACK5MV_10185 [Aminipila sp.]
MNKKYMMKKDKTSKNYSIYVLCLSILLIIMLTGCSLAKEELQQLESGNKLCGVFVTFEDELKDYMMQEGDTLYYDEKKLVRADGSIKFLTEKEMKLFSGDSFEVDGVIQKDGKYRFGNIQGDYLACRLELQSGGDDEEYYSSSFVSSGDIYNVKSYSNSSEEEEKSMMEGTIGVSSKYKGAVRMNPVYERADGSIYTSIPGSAAMMISEEFGGGSISKTITESYESKFTGLKQNKVKNENKKKTFSFTVSVEQKDYLESAIVRQFNKNNEMIKSSEIELNLQEQYIKLEQQTSYVIIEEKFVDVNDKEYIKRTTYDCDKVNFIEDNGLNNYGTHVFYSTDSKNMIKLLSLNFVR